MEELLFFAEAHETRMRLDLFLVARAPQFSRARLQAFIRRGAVRLNGKAARAKEIVRAGDRVTLAIPMPEPIALIPEHIPLTILFEDDDLLVINKPAGLSVHPGAGQNTGTLVHALLAHCRQLSGIGGKLRPGIVHRLDRETSGALLVAKNDAAHLAFSKQFQNRTVEKIYLALVAGKLRRNSGVIEEPIARHKIARKKMAVVPRGRAARTDYRVRRTGQTRTLLECQLHSGRTHQIRVHLQHLGHPVLGDKLYGGRHAHDFPRQMLHAWKLSFLHPRTGKLLHFEAPLAQDFERAIRDALK